ncbi:MAG: sterol desaturase family protein [Pseudomonadales bacterium]|nr:sterol desaturase family protein [Pseudomonadales bacterium]
MFGLEWWQYVLITLIGGNTFFLGIGGFIHYYHYHIKRDENESWKMQPNRFLSDRLSRHAALLGTFNMNTAAGTFGFLGWGVLEQGWGQIYYDFSDYGYAWAALSIFLAFFFIEACAYYMHAASHSPWLYKKIHKVHHYYSTPTYFTISAMHPLEWVAHASYIVAPAFLFPMHWSLYLFVMMTTFFYGFWDHSGIKLNINLPFHGTNKFHDDHHKYFHVNYGFLTPYFDRIHDTVRREGHHYTEDTFTGGKGRVNKEMQAQNAIGPWVDYSTPFKQKDDGKKQDSSAKNPVLES